MWNKLLLVLIFSMSTSLNAGTIYLVKPIALIHATSGPTFLYGDFYYYYVIGGEYAVFARDEATNIRVYFVSQVNVSPMDHMPTVVQFKNAARADAISKGFKAALDSALAAKIAEYTAPRTGTQEITSATGTEEQVVTLE